MNHRQMFSQPRDTDRTDCQEEALVVALVGNPNTGKSTVFNRLTGLKQHTGNWPGKTVANARGSYLYQMQRFVLVDLPGTYSLAANSADEEVTRDFLCSGEARVAVVVVDATCLARNLHLVLQVLEMTEQVVLCVNLLDEAERKQIQLDLPALANILGVPVIGTNARNGMGLDALKNAVWQVASGTLPTRPLRVKYGAAVEKGLALLIPAMEGMVEGKIKCRWHALQLLDRAREREEGAAQFPFLRMGDSQALSAVLALTGQMLREEYTDDHSLRDHIVTCIVARAEEIAQNVTRYGKEDYNSTDRRIDRILTSRAGGIPVMLVLLGIIFWITVKGANFPSQWLAMGFFWGQERLTQIFLSAGWPEWLYGLLVLGIYRTMAWVVSVMLPPMAIFFPLFTLLEDLGYLPRIAFNLDNYFRRACAHGKQALTMCMGFGCNAAGVIACRIIDSPRERLIAIITNNFVPCNGRFPTLIALATVFIAGGLGGTGQSLVAALSILAVIVLAVVITLVVSKLLSQTILQGMPSSFALELPPYRKPQIGRIIIRSLYDRTLFVLARALVVAAPAGMMIWVFANINIGSLSILQHGANILAPLAHFMGLDGFILMAFLLGLPANEIVLPILAMSYLSAGQMLEIGNLHALRELFVSNGWTWLTAVCTMLLCLNHFPCGTTLLTIRKETGSLKWTLVTIAITTATGIILCLLVAQSVRWLGLV